jgi:hypothetical protein
VKHGQIEGARSTAHAWRATSVNVMVAVGLAGLAAIALLVWFVVGRTRELTADMPGPIAPAFRPVFGSRPPCAPRVSRRPLTVRPKQ